MKTNKESASNRVVSPQWTEDRSDSWWTGVDFHSEVIVHNGKKIEFCNSIKLHLKWIKVILPNPSLAVNTEINLVIRPGKMNKAINLVGRVVKLEEQHATPMYLIRFNAINAELMNLMRAVDTKGFMDECQGVYDELKLFLQQHTQGLMNQQGVK